MQLGLFKGTLFGAVFKVSIGPCAANGRKKGDCSYGFPIEIPVVSLRVFAFFLQLAVGIQR